MLEGMYESDQHEYHDLFRDKTNGDFYPLTVEPHRIYLDVLYDYDTNSNKKQLHTVYFGIDKLMVDDSYIGGIAVKVLEFINLNKLWTYYQDQSWY